MKTDLAKTRLIGADIIRNPPPNVSTPRYDRGSITPGIVHIGVGNFHRAHQATYLDSLFNAGFDHDWGIIGAGILEKDAQMRKTLLAQDCLSTVVELDPMRYHAFICGSIIDYAPVDPAAIIQRLVRPEIRIVTLTITEGGYYMGA
ncbi:MAG: mannitol dehydrogenase family protein, partial [Pseudomonadota bacterium]